jgi:ketosteroid isomerase-like protein
MSEENVEMIRRGYEAYERRDLDAVVADFAPEFEYVAAGADDKVCAIDESWSGVRMVIRLKHR